MSVTVEASSISYDGNDVADEFDVPFKFLETNDLLVRTTDDDGDTYTTLVEDVDYTVAGEGEDEGGTVTTTDPVATGTSLVIERNTNITQESDFQPQGAFPVARHEDALDKLTLICQELERRLDELEAITTPAVVDAGSIVFADKTFLTGDTVEGSFPMNVSVTGGSTGTGFWAVRLQNLDDASEVFSEPPAIQASPGSGDNVSLKFCAGLQPNTNYTLRIAAVIP